MAQWEGVAHEVEVADEQILRDMDTPDDYLRLRQRAERLHIPTDAECRALLNDVLRVEPPIVRHGEAVAEVAVLLGEELNRAGCRLDIPLLAAAGLLHDLARKEPDHARAGARLLREWGHGAVADLVATHMEIHVPEGEPVSGAEVVYLADKLVQGERRVPLAERFRATMERHAHDPAILGNIAGRLKTALNIETRLEAVLGRPLAEVIGTI
jgi:HD superfamily phosphohydrolase YqeK